jgi:hypothetical protein
MLEIQPNLEKMVSNIQHENKEIKAHRFLI